MAFTCMRFRAPRRCLQPHDPRHLRSSDLRQEPLSAGADADPARRISADPARAVDRDAARVSGRAARQAGGEDTGSVRCVRVASAGLARANLTCAAQESTNRIVVAHVDGRNHVVVGQEFHGDAIRQVDRHRVQPPVLADRTIVRTINRTVHRTIYRMQGGARNARVGFRRRNRCVHIGTSR